MDFILTIITLVLLSIFVVGSLTLYVFAKTFRKSEYNLPIGVLFFVCFWLTTFEMMKFFWILFLYNEGNPISGDLLFIEVFQFIAWVLSSLSLLSVVCIRFTPNYSMEDHKCHSIYQALIKSIKAIRYIPELLKFL